jgi:WD40 repeat protein
MAGLPGTRLAPDPPGGPRAALVIATTRYQDSELRQLRAPVHDAEDLADVLGDPRIGAFTVTQVIDQVEGQVRREIDVFLSSRDTDDVVVVYLSCHGVLDRRGRLYFAAADTLKTQLGSTGISSAWLLDQLEDCRARGQVLILDCCFSGAFAHGSKGGDAELDLERRLAGQGRGRAVLTASRASEYSFEGQALPGAAAAGSVFTAGLVEGLRTGAADADGDGYVSVEEAYRYAHGYVRSSGASQTPQRWLSGGEGMIVLARNPAGVAVTPAPLPEALAAGLDSPYPAVRIGAVNALGEWLTCDDPARALIAEQKLRQIADTDAPAVAATARACLPSPEPARPPTRMVEIGACLIGKSWYVTLSPDARLLAAIIGETVQVWGPATGQHLHTLQSRSAAVAFSPDGRLLATGGYTSVQLWDPSTGEHVRALNGHTSIVPAVAFSPDGRLLAASDEDTRTHAEPIQPPGPDGRPSARRARPPWLRWDQMRLPFSVELWDLWTGDHLRTLEGHTGQVKAAAFSPDGCLLATGDCTTVQLWDPATAQHLRTLEGPTGRIKAAAFSPDGRLLATGDYLTVQLWDPATGQHLRTLQSHGAAVAFSPDGRLLATSDYLTVQLWNPATGDRLFSLEGLTGMVQVVGFSVDGRLLAATSGAHAVQLWSWAQPSH